MATTQHDGGVRATRSASIAMEQQRTAAQACRSLEASEHARASPNLRLQQVQSTPNYCLGATWSSPHATVLLKRAVCQAAPLRQASLLLTKRTQPTMQTAPHSQPSTSQTAINKNRGRPASKQGLRISCYCCIQAGAAHLPNLGL